MKTFEYEWWTVNIYFLTGGCKCEFKGKSRETVVRQINKYIKDNRDEILSVDWTSMELDRKGYQRRF